MLERKARRQESLIVTKFSKKSKVPQNNLSNGFT